MNGQLTVGSLFAGIGGFDLGLERAGMRVVWQCEIDPFCVRVLEKHWPDVLRVPDIRNVHAESHPDDIGCSDCVPHVDVLCGGFPCQDISLAGRGVGIEGRRSGLWGEFARLIGELRPRYVIVENVPALTSRGLDRVLADLAACGFDAEWDHLPASAFGAPHRRDRIWIVAYPNADSGRLAERCERNGGPLGPGLEASQRNDAGRLHADVADTDAERRDGRPGELGPGRRREPADDHWWAVEPDVGRVAHGIPQRVDRLRALGNALVPQIAEWIGRRIIEAEHAATGG